MKKIIVSLTLSLLSTAALACPSSVFTAEANGQAIAKIRGNSILDSGWKIYSVVEDADKILTRYSKKNTPAALWRYEMKNNTQPGIIWGVWVDSGIVEGMAATYEIRTNVRSIGGGQANLTPVPEKLVPTACRAETRQGESWIYSGSKKMCAQVVTAKLQLT